MGLRKPEVPVDFVLLLWDLHHLVTEEIPRFLFCIARCFSNGCVFELLVRTCSTECHPEGGPDQRTNVSGKHLVGIVDGPVRTPAQRDGQDVCCKCNLIRYIDAKRPERFASVGSILKDLGDPLCMRRVERPIKELHRCRSVFGGTVRLLMKPVVVLHKLIMEFYVDSDLPQDFVSVDHERAKGNTLN